LGSDGENATFVSWYWWDLNDRTRQFEKKFLDEAKKTGHQQVWCPPRRRLGL